MEKTRREIIRVFVGSAALAATSTSFLNTAFAATGSGEMALAGGGRLLVKRRTGGWSGVVVGKNGERIGNPSGWVVVDGGRLIGLDKGQVVDGTIKADDWTEHVDTITFTKHGSSQQGPSMPAWARGSVLKSQTQLVQRALVGKGRTITPRLKPTIAPAPGRRVSPQAPKDVQNTR